MREKDLLQIWNGQRSQRISSQLGPTILLAVILILVATGKLNYKSALDIKAFAIGLVAAGGVFSLTAMLASIRDSRALTRAMREASDISQLGLSVVKNSGNLFFTGFLYVALSLFNMAVLAIYLFKKP
jgi:predicted lysophospholipase L1 biosynthesis ABC-type transport system permease subunit